MPYTEHLGFLNGTDQHASRDVYAKSQIERMAKVAETIKANAWMNDFEKQAPVR
jgi:hypothetical protein